MLKKINVCETKSKLLDTLVVDQLLSMFKNEKSFVFPTYSTEGSMSLIMESTLGRPNILITMSNRLYFLCAMGPASMVISLICRTSTIFISIRCSENKGNLLPIRH